MHAAAYAPTGPYQYCHTHYFILFALKCTQPHTSERSRLRPNRAVPILSYPLFYTHIYVIMLTIISIPITMHTYQLQMHTAAYAPTGRHGNNYFHTNCNYKCTQPPTPQQAVPTHTHTHTHTHTQPPTPQQAISHTNYCHTTYFIHTFMSPCKPIFPYQ